VASCDAIYSESRHDVARCLPHDHDGRLQRAPFLPSLPPLFPLLFLSFSFLFPVVIRKSDPPLS
jgi:hypothetical protein